jgi:hypothetical protein
VARIAVGTRWFGSLVATLAVVAIVGCASEGSSTSPPPSPSSIATSPGVRLSGDQFWATLPSDVQSSICGQVADDPKAALDIAASYAASNPVFRSQLVKTIRAECV